MLVGAAAVIGRQYTNSTNVTIIIAQNEHVTNITVLPIINNYIILTKEYL